MVLGRFIDIILAVAAATWLAMAGVTGEVKAAAYDTSRLDRMPDFSQTDSRLGLPGGGSHYCVPVATANVLVWLAEHRGYKNLLPVQGLSTIEKVASVAGRLGSDELMSTAPKGGTNLQKFVDGLTAYVSEAGYSGEISAYGPGAFSNVSRVHTGAPDWHSIRSEFARGAGVWVSVSFFEETRKSGEWRRIGGHMATMAGFGVDERGSTDRNVIILHDPDDGHSASVQRRYLNTEPLRNVRAVDGSGRVAFELDDYLDVSKDFNMRDGYRAVITNVFLLDM
jgi:hypothetical protein